MTSARPTEIDEIPYNAASILLDPGAASDDVTRPVPTTAEHVDGPASESGVRCDRVSLQAARVDGARSPRHLGDRLRGRAPLGRSRRPLHEPRRHQGGLPAPAGGPRLRSPAPRTVRALPLAGGPWRLRALVASSAADPPPRARAPARDAHAHRGRDDPGPRPRPPPRAPLGIAAQVRPGYGRHDARAGRSVHAHLLARHSPDPRLRRPPAVASRPRWRWPDGHRLARGHARRLGHGAHGPDHAIEHARRAPPGLLENRAREGS